MNINSLTNINLPLIKKCFFIIVLLLILPLVHLQAINSTDTINKHIQYLKEKAITYDRNEDIYSAIDYYREYLTYKSDDIKLTYRLATLYFKIRDYEKANQYYDSVINYKSKKYSLAYYNKGIVCMNLEKYDEAIEAFTKFKKIYTSDKYNYRKLSAIYIENSSWAKSHSENDGEIAIEHPGSSLNHPTIDFSPFRIDENEIIYGAVYSDNLQNITPVRQIYKAINNNGQWKTVGLLDGEINNPNYNTGNAVVSADGQRMFFTRARKNWQDIDISEIYVSNFDGNTWLTPEKLTYPVNTENYTSTQPAIGMNLKTGNEIIYFVSDRPGGKGGLDIWYTEYDKRTNSYKEPRNLDRSVNSLGDECCPFYCLNTRTLYFSSKGRKNGFGGYDIYKSVGTASKWEEAIPLSKPVNSSFDDYYFSILPNNKEGFFTSNRTGSMNLGNGSCCDDIFLFKTNECTMISSCGTIQNSTNYDIYDNLNAKYHLGLQYPKDSMMLSCVPVELYLTGENGDAMLISKTTTNKNGTYHFDLERNKQYKILVKNYGYLEKKVPVKTFGINCSDTINIGTTQINHLPKINVRVNIYYDLDKYKLSETAEKIIDTTLIPLFDLFPKAIIEIGSHTDSIGTDEYNLKLSQRRSESVVNYLISKGISSEQLVAKGYGMRFPVVLNTNSDGTDNVEGRQLNRRTEIKIVGEVSSFNLEDDL